MRIHYKKLLKFVGTLVLTWIFLIFLKLFDFNFGIRIKHFFWPVFGFSLMFLFFEIKKNDRFLFSLMFNYLSEFKTYFRDELSSTMEKHIMVTLSKYLSREITSIIAYFVTFLRIIWKFFAKHVFNRKQLQVLLIIGMVFDVFVMKVHSDLLTLFLTFILIIRFNLYDTEGKKVIIWSIFLLALCLFFLIIGEKIYAEKSSSWLFIFFLIGVLRETSSLLKENNAKLLVD